MADRVEENMDAFGPRKLVDPLLVTKIVRKYVAHHQISASELSNVIATVYEALSQAATKTEHAREQPRTPAVPIRQSVTRDAVVCLECGWRGLMLRRHIYSRHGLDRDAYRTRWGLRPDHPLTAKAYSERRSIAAKEIGLGQMRDRKSEAPSKDALSSEGLPSTEATHVGPG